MSKCFYVTTAIDYVNGEPHLGHAYEKIITDVIARAHRALGESTFFLTGLDEHGQKVQQAATDLGRDPQEYCDGLATIWRGFAQSLQLINNDFVRTSSPQHKRVVQGFLNQLYQEEHFYKAEYRGFYSTRQESFLTDKDRLPDGTFDPFYGEVVELVEENYYFRLNRHQDWLIQHIESHPEFIAPETRRNEVLGFLRSQKLEDLCISRPAKRLNWGIPLPFDSDYVTYVWFDALLNYVTLPANRGDIVARHSLDLPPAPAETIAVWPADIVADNPDVVKRAPGDQTPNFPSDWRSLNEKRNRK